MSNEFLGDRKKALEESFFAKENAKLLARLREEEQRKEAKAGLAGVSGIRDEALLEKLAELEMGPDTWVALSLVPLVEVAWADGTVEPKERRAVLAAAEAGGVSSGSPSYELLERWLARRPDARLLETWGEYIVDLCTQLSPAERHALREQILGRARSVAEAAGGFLGLGNKISPEEEAVLVELDKAFAK
jgi:hypothetical protein